MLQLSGQDASFVYLETPHTPMHIGSVGIYDPLTAPGGFVRLKGRTGVPRIAARRARSFCQRLVRVPFATSRCPSPIYSYGDTIAISFTCDRAMMSDPDAYADVLRQSFAALQAATFPPKPAKKPAAAVRKPAKQGAA